MTLCLPDIFVDSKSSKRQTRLDNRVERNYSISAQVKIDVCITLYFIYSKFIFIFVAQSRYCTA